jgi:UDP-N-acetylglucosamine 2-epimerase
LGLEPVLLRERPDWVLLYGDTNSTLAGALAASKLSLRIAHVEAGLRSFNRAMPEEVNRVVTDHLSDLLFCPSDVSRKNLADEGITRGVHVVGDVMADALQWARGGRGRRSPLLRLGLKRRGYLLCTLHRAENTDEPARLQSVLDALNRLDEPVVFAMHPRTRSRLKGMPGTASALGLRRGVRVIRPVGYLDMVELERQARMILTDSGGIQKEAYWLGTPCITLREETEWVETVQNGWNVLAGVDGPRIVELVRTWRPARKRPPLYGDGKAARRIVEALAE